MLIAMYILNPLLMITLPIVLGVVLWRRLGQPWRLFFIGAATFILSQVVHIPLNLGIDQLVKSGLVPQPPEAYQLLFTAVVLGLSAGLCEEIARYLVYRLWIKDARHWRQALMFGAGHGGVEAIIVGAITALGVVNIVALSQMDLNTLGLTAEQLVEVQTEMAVALSYPWWYPLLGAIERVFALTAHVAMAVLVLQAVKRRNLLWLVAAILWHTLLNAVAVYVVGALGPETGPIWAEVALGGFALASLGIIWALREPYVPPPPPAPAEPLPLPAAAPLAPAKPTTDALDKTRYQ